MRNPINSAPILPPASALRLAKIANVPSEHRDEFRDRITKVVQDVCMRDRRSTGQEPGRRLRYAADAARTLQKEFSRLSKDDHDWVENIKQSQPQFLAGEIGHTETAIWNLANILNLAVGRRTPLPPWLEKNALKIDDQMLRELVFGLLAAAEDAGGKLTFNKNSESGTLVAALDLLRKHLPKGLVPQPLPASSIQRLKTDFLKADRLRG